MTYHDIGKVFQAFSNDFNNVLSNLKLTITQSRSVVKAIIILI